MNMIASQITSLTVVYSTFYSDANQRKHHCSASLAFVWGSHRDRWIPHTKSQLRGKCFHLMTSSWRDVNLGLTKCIAYNLHSHLMKFNTVQIIINTMSPGQNGRHFSDDIFKCTFLNQNASCWIKVSLKFFLIRVQLMIFQHWFRIWLGAETRRQVIVWANEGKFTGFTRPQSVKT